MREGKMLFIHAQPGLVPQLRVVVAVVGHEAEAHEMSPFVVVDWSRLADPADPAR
jgi:hypothetical protein